jgi:hypothetical protein
MEISSAHGRDTGTHTRGQRARGARSMSVRASQCSGSNQAPPGRHSGAVWCRRYLAPSAPRSRRSRVRPAGRLLAGKRFRTCLALLLTSPRAGRPGGRDPQRGVTFTEKSGSPASTPHLRGTAGNRDLPGHLRLWRFERYYRLSADQLPAVLHQEALVAGTLRFARWQRRTLERIADQLGDLELELSYSVEATADLGLLVPSLRAESFHNALYESMGLAARAATAGRMLQRLSAAISAELTAIESAERRADDNRRVRYAVAIGFVSAAAIPIGLIFAFLSTSTAQVHKAWSMFSHHYLGAYLCVAAIIVVGALLWLGQRGCGE